MSHWVKGRKNKCQYSMYFNLLVFKGVINVCILCLIHDEEVFAFNVFHGGNKGARS